MDKAKKRRNRRRNRDMRWVERCRTNIEETKSLGKHRQKKVLGVYAKIQLDHKGRQQVAPSAFWRRDVEPVPRISRLFFNDKISETGEVVSEEGV
jgi:hypothetical protein